MECLAHGGLERAGCERTPRTVKQMEGGQLPGRAGVETRPPCLRPQGGLWPPLSHFASASPAPPSFLDIWSPFLHPSIYGLLHFLSGFQGAVYKVTER